MRKAAAVFLVIALFGWLTYQATGSRFSGEATRPSDIPVVGSHLNELVFVSPASYRGYEHPHGGGTLTITGIATHESVVSFCDDAAVSLSQSGTNIVARDDILRYLESREIKLPDSSSNGPSDVLFGSGGRFRKLYGVYNATTERFVMSLQFDGSK